MLLFHELIQNAKSIAIAGHVRPDGDCVGSCLGMYRYLKEHVGKDRKIDVYLEEVPHAFSFLTGADEAKPYEDNGQVYDLFLALDCGSIDRLGVMEGVFLRSKETVCIDHHISNTAFAGHNLVESDASSTGEVLCGLFTMPEISAKVAECLYLAIVHDTGVFKHSNTKKRTMLFAGELIEKGVSSSKVIDDSFYKKTYVQNLLLGRCLLDSKLLLDGKVICSVATQSVMQELHAVASDMDGIIDQLRVTEGVEAAILLREEGVQNYKVSMRSNGKVDVCKICLSFGGGGHVMAAGCTVNGTLEEIMNAITKQIEEQLRSYQNE